MNFKPIGDRCIAKRLQKEPIAGKIITLNSEPSQFFEVIEVSGNAFFKKGDVILPQKYGFSTVEIEGIEYAILKNDDIMAVRE